jgi:hypothetical protein
LVPKPAAGVANATVPVAVSSWRTGLFFDIFVLLDPLMEFDEKDDEGEQTAKTRSSAILAGLGSRREWVGLVKWRATTTNHVSRKAK